jgi:murein DD-endopeptidase MepM/ murein hydrolase activator NlpD
MKIAIFIMFFLFVSFCNYAQKEKKMIELLIQNYEEFLPTIPKKQNLKNTKCMPEPPEFSHFFSTSFTDFSSLREGEIVNAFSFSDTLISPLMKTLQVTSGYGMRDSGKHFGVDFRVNIGDQVCSIFCGKVRIAKWDDTYGNVVVIRNYNMSETVFAHLDKILVTVNQEVVAGQIIGLSGNTGRSTGAHLHFELRYKGFPINPIVERKFLKMIPVIY